MTKEGDSGSNLISATNSPVNFNKQRYSYLSHNSTLSAIRIIILGLPYRAVVIFLGIIIENIFEHSMVHIEHIHPAFYYPSGC